MFWQCFVRSCRIFTFKDGHWPLALWPGSLQSFSLALRSSFQTILICVFFFFNLVTPLVGHHGFPGGSDGKESACNAGDLGSIPGLGRSPEEGNGNPLQYSCLGNPMNRRAWQAIVHGATKCQTRPSDWHFHFPGSTHYLPPQRNSWQLSLNGLL